MYNHIGEKIKGLAAGVFAVEAIGAIIFSFVLFAEEVFGAGVLVLLLGPTVAWISSWMLYAFGQLVEDTRAMREQGSKLDNINRSLQMIVQARTGGKPEYNQPSGAKQESAPKHSPPTTRVNTADATPTQKQETKETAKNMFPCPHCGEDLSFMGWNENDLSKMQTCPFCQTSFVLNGNKPQPSTKASAIPTEHHTVICSLCHFEQPNDRAVCWHCGATFEKQ